MDGVPPCVQVNREVHSTKWLSLRELRYLDPKGQERTWDSVERTTSTGPIDAVDVIAFEEREGTQHVLLVKQFRPPTGKMCLEFPAGLVDKGETAEGAALRELKEETGYIATILFSGAVTALEPGLTNETSKIIYAKIIGKGDTAMEETEFIESLFIPLPKLFSTLNEMLKDERVTVDAKVWTFAFGYSLK